MLQAHFLSKLATAWETLSDPQKSISYGICSQIAGVDNDLEAMANWTSPNGSPTLKTLHRITQLIVQFTDAQFQRLLTLVTPLLNFPLVEMVPQPNLSCLSELWCDDVPLEEAHNPHKRRDKREEEVVVEEKDPKKPKKTLSNLLPSRASASKGRKRRIVLDDADIETPATKISRHLDSPPTLKRKTLDLCCYQEYDDIMYDSDDDAPDSGARANFYPN